MSSGDPCGPSFFFATGHGTLDDGGHGTYRGWPTLRQSDPLIVQYGEATFSGATPFGVDRQRVGTSADSVLVGNALTDGR